MHSIRDRCRALLSLFDDMAQGDRENGLLYIITSWGAGEGSKGTYLAQTSIVDQPDQMEQADLNGKNNVYADQLQLFRVNHNNQDIAKQIIINCIERY